MNERRLTILGGHRDGEVVSDYGPVLRVPVPRPSSYITAEVGSLPDVSFSIDEHYAQQDDDGRWWYVRRGRE